MPVMTSSAISPGARKNRVRTSEITSPWYSGHQIPISENGYASEAANTIVTSRATGSQSTAAVSPVP